MAKKDLKEYRIWKAMKSRCYAPCLKHLSYQQKELLKRYSLFHNENYGLYLLFSK